MFKSLRLSLSIRTVLWFWLCQVSWNTQIIINTSTDSHKKRIMKLNYLATFNNQSALFPFLVMQSANILPVGTHLTDFNIFRLRSSFIPAIEFRRIFSSHCLELLIPSQRDLQSVTASTGICSGFLRSTFPA